MKQVFLYARVSTEEQAVHGLSIEAQLTALEAWAKANGHKVVGTYIDAGISARKPAAKRPELQRLLSDVRAGLGELIVFTKLDRWFRNIAEYYKVQEVLEKCHVDWRTIQEDYDTSTASGRLKINIMLSVAQDEADRTGERIKFIFEDKVQRGEVISGKVPLGYKIENKKMVVDPGTAPIAQDIFKQYTTIRSVRALREYVLNTYGLVYGQTGIRALLDNERYIGRAHGQDDFCPPLIPVEQFQLCQELLQQRAQRNLSRSGRVYLFTGLVRCAECGNRLSAHVVAQKYIYYRCTKYEKLHLCSHKKRTSELVLEGWLLENLVSSYEQYNISLVQGAKAKRANVDTDKIRRKMEKLKDLYLNDLIEKDAYEQDYISLRNQLRDAYTPEPEPPKPVDTKLIRTALSAYESLTRQEKKEFWCRVVGSIAITNEDRFFVEPVRHN
ncbi:MAG: recombinase family protein [Oscillospiraceae bacterium]|nr:recombinase family protein [Oscillospiraceae bacterium]